MLNKLVYLPLLIINIVVGVLFIITGYSYFLHPEEYPILALSGLTFPLFGLGIVGFLVFWLFFKKIYAIVPLFFLLVCYVPVNKYCPWSKLSLEDTKSLRIMSWNVHSFRTYDLDSVNTLDSILNFVMVQNVDILCFQEANLSNEVRVKFGDLFEYMDNYEELVCMSHFPITKVESIDSKKESHNSACFYVKTDKGTLRVVNCHLQCTGLDIDDREGLSSVVESSIKDEESRSESKRMFKTISEGMKKRAPQAENIAKFVGEESNMTIVLGDFNDTPISYSHYCLDRIMKDCYAKKGALPGFSYMQNMMFVRIDHTFCSEDLEVKKCWVDIKPEYSDHYPIITTFLWDKDID